MYLHQWNTKYVTIAVFFSSVKEQTSQSTYEAGMIYTHANQRHLFGLLVICLQSDESAICPLPHICAHRCPWLANVIVIDREERVYHSLLPWEHGHFCSFRLPGTGDYGNFRFVISRWYGTCYSIARLRSLSKCFELSASMMHWCHVFTFHQCKWCMFCIH